MKRCDSIYEAGLKSKSWIAIKKGIDSVDLLIVGGFYGKGRRRNIFGSFLLACLNDVH